MSEDQETPAPKTPAPQEKRPAPGNKNGNGKARSGKGLAALMLVLGLLVGLFLGGLVGLFIPRTGVLDGLPGTVAPSPTPTPVPTIVERIVEVDKPVTPAGCLVALEDLSDYLNELSDSREALMRADLARVSGDEEAASSGLAEVDRQLRSLILAGNARSLRSAVDQCRSASGEPPEPDAAPATPEPDATSDAEPTPTAPNDPATPSASPTPQQSPEPIEGS